MCVDEEVSTAHKPLGESFLAEVMQSGGSPAKGNKEEQSLMSTEAPGCFTLRNIFTEMKLLAVKGARSQLIKVLWLFVLASNME